jgi:tripartite-type tricarboxylate transporter receptor subunit TctC
MRHAKTAMHRPPFSVPGGSVTILCHRARKKMKTGRKRPFLTAMMLLAAILLPARTAAEASPAWPQRAVKLVVPLGPASGADVTARLLADRLSQRWGQPVVVENRPGADGIVGVASFIGGSDDHALLLAPSGTFTASPLLHPGQAFNPDRLAPVARLTTTLIAIAVPDSTNVKSLAELVKFIRARPDSHWASTTGATDLVFSGFLNSAGLSMIRVPYRDGVLALNDLGEGRIEVYMSALTAIQPHAAGGRVRVLALSNHRRAAAAPDVPTVQEAGYPALEYDGLVGLFAGDAMPAGRREQIAADVLAVISDPDFAQKIAATGQIVHPGTPAELARAIAEQSAVFKAIAGSLGLLK